MYLLIWTITHSWKVYMHSVTFQRSNPYHKTRHCKHRTKCCPVFPWGRDARLALARSTPVIDPGGRGAWGQKFGKTLKVSRLIQAHAHTRTTSSTPTQTQFARNFCFVLYSLLSKCHVSSIYVTGSGRKGFRSCRSKFEFCLNCSTINRKKFAFCWNCSFRTFQNFWKNNCAFYCTYPFLSYRTTNLKLIFP